MNRELREFRRLERLCLEQAAVSTLDLARSGLLQVADDCRIAAEAIEARSHRGGFAGAVQALKLALSPTQMPTRRRH